MRTRSYSISGQNQWLKRNGNLCAAKELRGNRSHFHRVNRKVLRRKIAKTSRRGQGEIQIYKPPRQRNKIKYSSGEERGSTGFWAGGRWHAVCSLQFAFAFLSTPCCCPCKMAFAAPQQNGGGVGGSCFSQHTYTANKLRVI